MITGIFEERPSKLTITRTHSLRTFPLTFHAHVELIYVHSGQLTLCVDGQTTTLRPGDLSVCFPYLLHQSEQSDADVTLLLFDPSLCGGLLNTLSSCKPDCPFLRKASVPPIVPELLGALLPRAHRSASDDAVVCAYLTALMGEITDQLALTPLPLSKLSLAQQILTYCMGNYRSDLTLESVAEALSIRKTQVTRTLLRLNLNFRDYVNELRISAACRLLTQTDIPITDIVYESGFNNQGTFNRLFLKHCGITPSEYRTQHTGDPLTP